MVKLIMMLILHLKRCGPHTVARVYFLLSVDHILDYVGVFLYISFTYHSFIIFTYLVMTTNFGFCRTIHQLRAFYFIVKNLLNQFGYTPFHILFAIKYPCQETFSNLIYVLSLQIFRAFVSLISWLVSSVNYSSCIDVNH